MEPLPVFSDAALARLRMPVLAIVGAHDALLDSADTKRRLERSVPHAEVEYLPDAGHMLVNQTAPILAFLQKHAQAR
jgi:pimeloyl-ACP methyl ester carboxylesterase